MKRNAPKITRAHKHYLKKAGKINGSETPAEMNELLAGNIQSAPKDILRAINKKKLEKLTHETEQAALDLAERKKTVAEVARVLSALAKNVARARAMLDAAFRSELPSRLGGRPADEIALENGKRLDEIYLELSKPLV